MRSVTSRVARATGAVCDAVATVTKFDRGQVLAEDDLVDDLGMDELELESLGLILEEVFACHVPEELWASPLYRTPESLAEWCIRKSDEAAWTEVRRVG